MRRGRATKTHLSAAVSAALFVATVAAPASAVAASQPDLAVTLTGPTTPPLVGDDFDYLAVVTNGGDAAPDAFLSLYLPPELTFRAVDHPACAFDEYAGVTCDLGTMASGASASATVSVTRTGARETWTSAWVSSSAEEISYDDNYADAFLEADTSNPVDLAISMHAPRTLELGEVFAYTISVSNRGPSTATGVIVEDYLGDGVDPRSVSSSDPADSCTGLEERFLSCELGSLAAGATTTITLRAERTSPWELWNSASVRTSSYDTRYENDWADSVITAHPSVTADLSLVLRDPADTPLVGDRFSYELRVRNAGPAAATDVWITDFMPDGVELRSASTSDGSCDEGQDGTVPPEPLPGDDAESAGSSPAYGALTVSCTIARLAAGASATVTIDVTRTGARQLWNSAWAWAATYDPTYDDTYAEVVTGPDTTNPADISLDKTAPEDAEVGQDFDYVLAVTNYGPSAANDVFLSDVLPDGVDFREVTSSDPADDCSVVEYGALEDTPESSPYWGYREVACELGSLAPGEAATVTAAVTRTADWELWNGAWATTSSYDPDPDDDSDGALVAGEPRPTDCPPGPGPATGTAEADEIRVDDCPVLAEGGDDTIGVSVTSGTREVEASAGPGNDTVTVDVLAGGAAGRTIRVLGGEGDDVITLSVAPAAGDVTVILDGGRGADRFVLDLPSAVRGLLVRVLGGPGKDSVEPVGAVRASGSAASTGLTILGGGSGDVLYGGLGPDAIRGGRGNDLLDGGAGNDVLAGGPGVDTCRDGPGRDHLQGC